MQDFFSKIDQNEIGILRYWPLISHSIKEILLKKKYNFNEKAIIKALKGFAEKCTATPVTQSLTNNHNFNFHIKREDLNLFGSHKKRALSLQIAILKSLKIKTAVISSSGNAVIAGGYYAKKGDVKLISLMSDKSTTGKLQLAAKTNNNLYLSKKASRLANYISKKHNIWNLKPSIDPFAIIGFQSLGYEIFEQYLKSKKKMFWTDIYIFSTSGASYLGLFYAFKQLKALKLIKNIPNMHMVKGYAGKLGAKITPLNKFIEKIPQNITSTIQINEKELQNFKKQYKLHGLSDESLSSILAAINTKAGNTSLVISTGKAHVINKNQKEIVLKHINTPKECDKVST